MAAPIHSCNFFTRNLGIMNSLLTSLHNLPSPPPNCCLSVSRVTHFNANCPQVQDLLSPIHPRRILGTRHPDHPQPPGARYPAAVSGSTGPKDSGVRCPVAGQRQHAHAHVCLALPGGLSPSLRPRPPPPGAAMGGWVGTEASARETGEGTRPAARPRPAGSRAQRARPQPPPCSRPGGTTAGRGGQGTTPRTPVPDRWAAARRC